MRDGDIEFLPEHLPLRVPKINPVPHGASRPFWTVMIPTYNRPHFLQQALRSVLQQDPGPERMQIEVIDNCSIVADIEDVVRRVGGTRVGYFRQPGNLGHFMNGLTCLQRSRGHWIHILHDDDLVLPGFYSTYERLIETYPDATLLMGPSIHVDERLNALQISTILSNAEGPVPDFAARQAIWNQVATPTAVVPRRIYERLGGFPKDLGWSSDWEMWFRAGTAGQTVTTTLPYALYRMHGDADSIEKISSETNISESIRMIDMLCKRLAPDQRKLVPRNRYKRLADAAFYYSDLVYKSQRLKSSVRQLQWSVRLHPRPSAFARLARISLVSAGRSIVENSRLFSPLSNRWYAADHNGAFTKLIERAGERGLRVICRSDYIAVCRGRDCIRIHPAHSVYLGVLIDYFDYYFPAVVPRRQAGVWVADYSARRVHRLRSSGVEFEFPSLPESDESTETYLKALHLKQGDFVLDLGAYAGASSYFFSKAVGPSGLVAAFEPDPNNLKSLLANVARHHLDNLRVFAKGVWGETGMLSFQAEGNLGSALAAVLPRESNRAETIPVVTLADAAASLGGVRVDAIKMDIEGAEVQVLRNAGDFLRQHQPRLIIEPHPANGSMNTDEVCKILRGHGYVAEIVSQGLASWPLIAAHAADTESVKATPSSRVLAGIERCA